MHWYMKRRFPRSILERGADPRNLGGAAFGSSLPNFPRRLRAPTLVGPLQKGGRGDVLLNEGAVAGIGWQTG